jgi:serine/threonine protein kinase, bacterial
MFSFSDWRKGTISEHERCSVPSSGHRSLLPALVLLPASMLGACGGGDGEGAGSPTYTVGGTVSGLTGSGLVLRNNGGDSLPVFGSAFTFATKVANGAAYAVTVSTQPTNPAQTCVVTSGNGTVGSNNVSNIAVDCTRVVSGTFLGVDFGISGTEASDSQHWTAPASSPALQ